MPRTPLVPAELSRGPFHFAEARQYGITKHHLVGGTWQKLGGGYYALSAIADQPLVQLFSAMRRLPAEAVFCGRTAAWLHGFDVASCTPIEVVLPASLGVAHLQGLVIHRAGTEESEVVLRKGLRVTSSTRTVCDLARRADVIEAVAVLDIALHRALVDIAALVAMGRCSSRLARCEAPPPSDRAR